MYKSRFFCQIPTLIQTEKPLNYVKIREKLHYNTKKQNKKIGIKKKNHDLYFVGKSKIIVSTKTLD